MEAKKEQEAETQIEKEIDWKDKYTRIYADFENFRKRVQKEKIDLSLSIKSDLLGPLMDLDSDINIAIKNSNDEGVKLMYSKLSKYLESNGIEEIQTLEYDDNLHEVISKVTEDSNKIISVVAKGYTLYGKPVRFPKVILGK